MWWCPARRESDMEHPSAYGGGGGLGVTSHRQHAYRRAVASMKAGSPELGDPSAMNGQDDVTDDVTDDVADDLLILHEDVLEEDEEGVKEILGDYAGETSALQRLCQEEVRLNTDASWGMNVIHRAAAVGNTSILEILMNADPSSDLNRWVSANNLAPIHLAAWEGHTHMVSYLAANGATVNAKDARERTPMHLAAETGSRDVAQILVVKGAKCDLPDSQQMTPLHHAARRGHAKMIGFLIKRGAPVDAKDAEGKTVLHHVLPTGRVDCLVSLLSYEADTNAKDLTGSAPLHYSIGAPCKPWDGRRQSVDFKQDKLGEFDTEELCQKGPVEVLVDAGADVNATNDLGETALHLAVRRNELGAMNLLMRSGADVDAKDNQGKTPMFGAKSITGVELLAKNGASMTAKDAQGNMPLHDFAGSPVVDHDMITFMATKVDIDDVNEAGRGPLFMACEKGGTAKVKAFLKADADVDIEDKEYRTVLMVSLEYGHDAVARTLLDWYEIDVNIHDKAGRTAIHEAARSQCMKAIALLIENEADVNAEDKAGLTAAAEAIKCENVDILKLLLDKGATVKENHVGKLSPLHSFAELGDLDMVKLLTEQGLNIDRRDARGRTPLHVALAAKAWDVATFLLNKKATANSVDKDTADSPLHLAARDCTNTEIFHQLFANSAIVKAVNKAGDTALHICVQQDQAIEVLDAFVDNGADVIAYNATRKTPAHIIIENCEHEDVCLKKVRCLLQHKMAKDLDIKDADGATLLHKSCVRGFVMVVDYLIDSGANITRTDKQGRRALHFAARADDARSISTLLLAGAEIDTQDSRGATPLYCAVECGALANAQELINQGAKPGLRGGDLESPLHLAIVTQENGILGVLLAAKPDVNDLSTKGLSSLHLAAQYSTRELVYSILSLRADVNAKDGTGRTPLHYACSNADENVMRVLLSHGGMLNHSDVLGDAPLHLCAEKGSYAHVELLIEKAVDINATNIKGLTALHKACVADETDVMELLVANEANVNVRDKKGRTPLMIALSKGKSQHASILLHHRAEVKFIDYDGQSALHKIAKSKEPNLGIIQQLVQKGLSLTARDKKGRSPIAFAEGDTLNFMKGLMT